MSDSLQALIEQFEAWYERTYPGMYELMRNNNANAIDHHRVSAIAWKAAYDPRMARDIALIKAGFMACVDMGPPDEIESDDGTYTTTYTWEEPDYEAVLAKFKEDSTNDR